MWQGADFVGGTCRQVIIDRIPFPRPDDEALALDRIESDDQWKEVDRPVAAERLAQGVGRLIRCPDDSGVVAVLDSRIASRGYGRTLLDALPPVRRARKMRSVLNY